MASKGDTVSGKNPIELTVLQKHEQALIGLMQASIDRVKRSLYAKGLLGRTNIAEQHELLTRESRMQKVLEYVLRLMEKESEEKEGQIFEKFLDSLKDELAWNFLRDKLSKKATAGIPTAEVFRENLFVMVEVLHTSVVKFPGILATHGIDLDDATKEQAINQKPEGDITTQVMRIVQLKVKSKPKESFKKFIDSLREADSFFFEDVIKDLEQGLKQAERAKTETAEEDEGFAEGRDLTARLTKIRSED